MVFLISPTNLLQRKSRMLGISMAQGLSTFQLLCDDLLSLQLTTRIALQPGKCGPGQPKMPLCDAFRSSGGPMPPHGMIRKRQGTVKTRVVHIGGWKVLKFRATWRTDNGGAVAHMSTDMSVASIWINVGREKTVLVVVQSVRVKG